MKIQPEDRPKLIGLILAVTALAVYMVLVVVPRFRRAGPPPMPPPAATPAVAQDSPAPQPPEQLSAALYTDATAPAARTPDPFTPAPGSMPAVKGSRQTVAPAASGSVGHPVSPAVNPIAPPPPMELQGVVLGATPLAVLMVGNRVLYAHEGDSLGYGVVLTRITELAVRVSYDRVSRHIDIGHSIDVSGDHRLAASRPVDARVPQALPPALTSMQPTIGPVAAPPLGVRPAPSPAALHPVH